MAAGTLATLLASAAASSAASVYNNQQNIKYAQEANDVSVGLANTAHQREVRDLEAAGLNPILSASTKGADVPQLRTPSLEDISGGISSSGKSLARAINGLTDAEVDTAKADAKVAQADAQYARRFVENEARLSDSSTALQVLENDARIDALEGTYSLDHYLSSEGAYADLVQQYRNEIKSGAYKSSLGHAIYDDIRDGISSASDLVGAAKGIKGMLPEKPYRDVKSTTYRRDSKGRVIDKTVNRRRLPR